MVAIITLNYNQNNFTLKCVESVLKSNFTNFKLILVDNGSTHNNYDELKKLVPTNDSLIIERLEDNRGYVGGINYGLLKAAEINPDYIMIMNNDTILDTEAITELRNTCKLYQNKAIVTGKVYHYDEPNKFQDLGYVFKSRKKLKSIRIGLNEEDTGQYDDIADRDLLDDVFWLFHINLYHEIGGYSTDFWFNAEQADFALRAKKKDYQLIYTPNAKLWHKGSVSIGGRNKNPKLAYWHTQSTLIYRFKHLSTIEFVKQYFKHLTSTIRSYLKVIFNKLNNSGKNDSYDYPKAKLKGFLYFNKWLFLRNENIGKNPFN